MHTIVISVRLHKVQECQQTYVHGARPTVCPFDARYLQQRPYIGVVDPFRARGCYTKLDMRYTSFVNPPASINEYEEFPYVFDTHSENI